MITVCIVLVLVAVLGIFWAIISGIGEQEVSSETKIQTMEEVGGYQQWVEDGYPGKVRTDIVVDLPVSARESSNYCVHILTSLGDPIFIEQKDGSNADTWEWLKANVALIKSVEDEMKGNSTQESFIGVSGTYTSGSAGDYGVIDVEVIDNEHINVAIGTGEALGYLGGVGGGMDGTIIDAYTAVVDWGAGLYFVLSWSDAGIMVVTREGSTDYDVLDAVTDNVEYVNIDYYPVS